jgi:aspartate/methionine/tyrosine aminotransferase
MAVASAGEIFDTVNNNSDSDSRARNMSNDNMNNDHQPVQESTIRLMTRLAIQYDAVNLSQGFPNEPPPSILRLKCALAILQGQPPSVATEDAAMTEEQLEESIIHLLSSRRKQENGDSNDTDDDHLDHLNQYSPPMGRPDLRASIATYYRRFYDYDVSPDDITVTLGATEAFASALRATCRPGDKVVIIEPFHELYPSQAKIFYLEPVFVPLRPKSTASMSSSESSFSRTSSSSSKQWHFDAQELDKAMTGARALLLNTPHNPTGKVFTREELKDIVDLCLKHDVYLITDEIYEHILWQNLNDAAKNDDDDDGDSTTTTVRHWLIPKEFPDIRDKTLVCNSLGKSASATGWRVGWCLHPRHLSESYRGIHDQLAVMAPHPQQYATISYLTLPDEYFTSLANKYRSRVQRLAETLKHLGFDVVDPQGAYYLFVNYQNVQQLSTMTSMEAAMFLLRDVGVACVPGDNFYGSPSDDTNNCYLRFAACRSDGELDKAIKKLKQHLG